MSKIFKNTLYVQRDYEVSQIVACFADEAPADHFVEMEKGEPLPKGIDMLYIERQSGKEVEYWGFM